MSTERTATPVPGISSRRFACDRCRVQKARCLREHADQARCDRCVRADAECVTSPMSRRRSWQIIAYDGPNLSMLGAGSKKRQRRGHDQDCLTPSESSGALGTQLSSGSHNASPFYSEQSAALPNSSSFLTQTLAESSSQHTAGEVTGFEDMFSQPTDPSLEYIQDSLGFPDDFFMPSTLSTAEAGPHVLSVPSCDYPDSMRTASSHATGPSALSNDPASESGGIGTPDSKDSGNTAQQDAHSPVQQLSKLDYELVTLLTSLDKGRPHVTMDTLICPINNSRSSNPAVDDILNRTREFVDVLKSFSGQQPSSATAQSSQRPSERRSSQSDTSHGSLGMDHDTPSDSSTQSMASTSSYPSPTKSDARPVAALDSASLLAILTVYIRVLRLHLIIFANVYDLLKELSESDDPVLCPVPGLNFSSFPIQSGNLQTIILIQIVTSLFERLETLLGLPREFRIGGREPESPGLFGQQGFMKTAGPIMRNEEAGASDHGKGGVKALRRHIKKTKQLLKESIAP